MTPFPTIPTGDHLRDHFIHRHGTTSETTSTEPLIDPTDKGRDHLRDHPRPLGPGRGLGGGPYKGTTRLPPTATPQLHPDQGAA